MSYTKWNTYLGWLIFLIATAVYFITIEDTVSLWDCGEYITAAYKLEVGHPPGAPLFMVLGRLFSFFAEPENVAVWINRLSAISSSLTILFLFWSLTLLIKKMILKDKKELSCADQVIIFVSAAIGSLAYTFSDSFWFSAVEGEVYAMASLFTAGIFWAILKWDEEMMQIQDGSLSSEIAPNRWILLIMFLLGLAIGVHLLGILVVPAIGFMIYFRYWKNATLKGVLITGLVSIFVLGFIQEGVIPGSISLASAFEVAFVNSLGLPFFSGTIFFFGLLTAGCIWALRYTRNNNKTILYNAVMGLILLLIGYGSFAVIVIRSNANTPLDENDPENLVTLHSYLKREQYGTSPLLFGPYWNSIENDPSLYDSRSPFYLRRFVVTKGDQVLKAFQNEDAAKKYALENTASYEEKYFESNEQDRLNSVPTYAQTAFFPRMYSDQSPQHIEGYKKWSGYDPNDGTPSDKGKDGLRLPTFSENMTYFFRYQCNWMYWRYFMWNFAGRQNDIQGHGDAIRGNWISGFSAVDNARLGDQEKAPYFTSQNPANNRFFFLPLIFGVIGIIFHFWRAPKDAFVLFLAFLFTGLAIVIYLNQKPIEPRERDYAYAGSFYFFAFWIGIGVYALYEAFLRFSKADFIKALMTAGGGLFLFGVLDMNSELSMPSAMSWLIIASVSLALIGLMMLLRNVMKKEMQGAVVAGILGFSAPLIMGMQGWDDHDRSLKTSADDLAINYLESCSKNGIIFTNGDNDTFPLWYMQEVEGKRTDVRVCNLSLMQTDWYTDQMKMRAYESDPLPIKFREDQILMYAGNTDQVLFSNLFEMFYLNANEKTLKEVINMRLKHNRKAAEEATLQFNTQALQLSNGFSSTQPNVMSRIQELKIALTTNNSTNLTDVIYSKYRASLELLNALQNGMITLPEGQPQVFQDMVMNYDKSWDYTDLKDAMDFVRNDEHLVIYSGQRKVRLFPSKGFTLGVNVSNAIKSGIIKAKDAGKCLRELRFNFDARGLTREQVMMLDILANNDWKRGIYFSSPGGSDVSIALYTKGYVKQNGMAFELSPIDDMSIRYSESMYPNLMTKYAYGAMSNPDVLTDYYTRRHTAQYRLHFTSLADDLLAKADQADSEIEFSQSNIKRLKSTGVSAQAKQLEASLNQLDKQSKTYREKARKLIHRSLQVMPAEVVIDCGEPSQGGREKYSNQGVEFSAYSDGILHDYVGILYRSGDIQGAEKLGNTVADQLESIFTYFVESDSYFAANPENSGDLYAALDAYFKMYTYASDPSDGNKNGAFAKRLSNKIEELYKNDFPKMYNEMEEKANANGESTRRGAKAGRYASMLFQLQDYLEAIGVHFGYLQGKSVPKQEDMSPMEVESLLQQVPIGDSVKQ
jgi:hypothetical protein